MLFKLSLLFCILLQVCYSRDATAYYDQAAEAIRDGLEKTGDFFNEKFQDAKAMLATTPAELQERVKYTQYLLEAMKAKKDVLAKSADKQSKVALDKLNEWYDSTSKYAKEAKDVSQDKFDELNKRWTKTSAEMYKNGFDDFVNIAKHAKKTGKAKMDDASAWYSDAYEQIKDALSKGSDWASNKYDDAKSLSAKTPDEFRKRVKDTQELLEAVRAKKDVLSKNANKQSKVALDKLNEWYDATAAYAKEGKDVSEKKFDELNKRWSKTADEMYKNGFGDIAKIAKSSKKTLRQTSEDASETAQAYYAKAADIAKDGLATLSDFFSTSFVTVKDFVAHSPEEFQKRLKDTQDLIETMKHKKDDLYVYATENGKVALDNLEHYYEVTKDFAAEAKDVTTDKYADLSKRWQEKSEEMYGTGFDQLIKIAQETKKEAIKTIKKKADEL